MVNYNTTVWLKVMLLLSLVISVTLAVILITNYTHKEYPQNSQYFEHNGTKYTYDMNYFPYNWTLANTPEIIHDDARNITCYKFNVDRSISVSCVQS